MLYTRTGDEGYTSLADGTRVPKTHVRIEAVGSADELNAHLGLLLAALLLCSCSSIRFIPVERVRTDTTYLTKVRHDSIYVHDSIFVYQKGDSVIKTVERYRYLYRDRVDTLYMSKTDTVTVHDVEYRDKPERWYDTGFRRLGQLCVLGLLAWLLWCLVKRKI